MFYAFNRSQGPPVAQSVQFNLKQIGLDVEIKLFDRVVQNTKAATRGEAFDMTHEGWHADYPDPSNFINVLLDGRRLQAANNVNTSYFSGDGVPNFNAKLDKAYAAAGSERLNLYAALDRDIMANGAPDCPVHLGHDAPLLRPECWLLRLQRPGGHGARQHLQDLIDPTLYPARGVLGRPPR